MKFKLLATTFAFALAMPAAADVLVDNVEGITFDEDGKIKRFNALVIDDDGKVAQILSSKDKKPQTDYRENGRGAVMIPGLIDAHAHVMGIGIGALTLDLSETNSLEEALDKIRRFAAENESRPWILGRGWNQEKWGLGRFPTAAELDSAVSDRPVYLQRVDGHAGWANSIAMQAAGITAETKSPEGGRVERMAGSQQPSGVFVDAAEELMTRAIPAPRPNERDLAFAEAQKVLNSYGITAVADMGTTIEDWQVYRRAGDEGRLRLRISAWAEGTQQMELIAGARPTVWLYDQKLRLTGTYLPIDGAPESGRIWLSGAAQPPAGAGRFYDDSDLRNSMVRSAMDGFPVALGAHGDGAVEEAVAAIAELSQTYTGDNRWRIVGASGTPPVAVPAGLTVRFGGPGGTAGTAEASFAPISGPASYGEYIATSALAARTLWPAKAGDMADFTGSLAPGKQADFVLFEPDLRRADSFPAEVSETWIGGQPVWRSVKAQALLDAAR